MKKLKFQDKESWFEARRGKVTGTRLKDLIIKRGTTKKIGFYELIAERIAIPPDDENPMERGTRLESEAIAKFEEETKKKVNTDLELWVREDNEDIALSPDGSIEDSEAVEVKCLNSASHIKAFLTQKVPNEYVDQTLQYFIVNDDLDKLHVVFYDPRVMYKDYFVIEINRAEVEDQIELYTTLQHETLKEVKQIINDLSF